MERVIKSTLDDYWQAQTSVYPDSGIERSREVSVVEEHKVEHFDRLLRDLEDTTSRIVGEGHRDPVDMYHQDAEKRKQLNDQLDRISAVLERLEQWHIRFEACTPLRDQPVPSSPVSFIEDDGIRMNNLERTEYIFQTADDPLNGGFSVVGTAM